MTSARSPHSLETILTFENNDRNSEWSTVWSTAHIPGMDNAIGGVTTHRRLKGRRRLRLGSLAIGCLLAMHCRVTASAVTGGLITFVMYLALACILLANPLRHFEVYLGQWSISGPGRAFRIIPMFDGIGIAICINAIIRAINCGTIAAIAAVYVLYSVADAKLPFTYCRDFELNSYEPKIIEFTSLTLHKSTYALKPAPIKEYETTSNVLAETIHNLSDSAWRNSTESSIQKKPNMKSLKLAICKESFTGRYPPIYTTPAYNFFFIEVVRLRPDFSLTQLNVPLFISIVFIWIIIWICMIIERLLHGRGIADAMEVGLYIHSASVGTELIHGKGLNHFASGHIDPDLNNENVWHSVLTLLLAALHSAGGTLCAVVDYLQPNSEGIVNERESNLWIIPMFSKCTSGGNYTHLMSSLIFGGLMFSYATVAFVLLKTALHTIFEYRVKLVFVEQFVVAGLILSCMALSLLFSTNGGIALLEAVESINTGVTMPFVCLMELVGMLYVYRSHDFISDLNLAMEEDACSTRISAQWQFIPLIVLVTLIGKACMLSETEIPKYFIIMAIVPLSSVVLAVPLRACHNAYVFLRSRSRR
ncbi:sodium-dependent noradrenaline transporter isoform X4 [Bombyx mori]|uniref:sodium-dependent noradrenaline transporter isoform X4 n=1 Tax=Bombyx mori TaxID=7091 RepID=UPI002ED04C03